MVLGWAEGRRVEWLVNLLYYRNVMCRRENVLRDGVDARLDFLGSRQAGMLFLFL